MKKFITKNAKVFNRFLSLILVVTLLVGMIPESVYAGNQKTSKVGKEYNQGDLVYTYTVESSWGNSVNATIDVKNQGDKSIDNWQLVLYYNGIMDNIWNADITSNENGRIVICAKDYNKTIKAGKSVSFGFIAHGENSQPGMPEKIVSYEADRNQGGSGDSVLNTENPDRENTGNIDDENTNVGNNSGDYANPENDSDKTNTDSSNATHIFPEELNGLNYALLTTDASNLNVNACELNVTGDVHTNKTFQYSGTSIKVDGSLEASERVVLYTSSASDAKKIGKKVENAKSISMPDITNQIYRYAKENGTYVRDSISYNADKVVLNKPILTDGSATFNASQFLGKGVIYAKDSISYNISSLATPDDSKIFLASENGNINISGSNINLNAVLYAPNGTVNINCSSLHLNGRIIAKKVCMNGSYLNINAGPYDYEMIDFLYKPELSLEVEGTFKENRKVTLTLSDITNADTLGTGEISWSIEKVGSNEEETNTSFYLIDEEVSNDLHKEMLFKESGTYLVTVIVIKENQSFQVTKELTITEDESPIAAFTLGSNYYYRNQAGECQVTVSDNSISKDGDTIIKRTWYLSFDANNNGEFEESEKQVISNGNEEEITITKTHVGKYKVELEVQETYEDTIKKLLNEGDYLTDDTKEYEAASSVFEIGNIPPKANIRLEKVKKADILFTVGECDVETLQVYNQKAKELEALLKENGVDARIETVSTDKYTAQDTFTWKEYDHYNYEDNHLPTLEKHIVYDEDSIKMIGYSYDAMKDFLYLPDNNSGRKTFEFDLQRDKTNWHSMEGGGFLFNTTVSEEENTIQGFAILVTQVGLHLVQIDCDNLIKFRDGGYTNLNHAGKLLGTFPMENLYEKHHIKIIVNGRMITVWDDDKIIIDHFVLPDADYGYGFGPITSHTRHSCSQQSYFTFSNIKMESIIGASLTDVINGYDWRGDTSRYVLNLSEDLVPELSVEDEIGGLAAALIHNEAKLIGIGNETNEEQFQKLFAITGGNGSYYKVANLSSSMDEANQYILDCIQAVDYSIEDRITTDVTVSYNGFYYDEEGDTLYAQNWEYEYDPNIFGEIVGETTHIIRTVEEPITRFEETGGYAIRLNVRDNPVSGNDIFDEYRLWSDTKEYEKLLMVETRPVAEISVEVIKNTNREICNTKVNYNAYDKDHMHEEKKGIREEYFYYQNLADGQWKEGRLPNVLKVGETYLVMYQVKDVEGTLSLPATYVVETNELLTYTPLQDKELPEIYLTPDKYEIAVGETIQVEGYALDDTGVQLFEMYVDGVKELQNFGRVFITGQKAGTITIKAVAQDIGYKKVTKEIVITVADKRDTKAPTAEITSPSNGAEIDFAMQILGTATDETEFKRYTLSYKGEMEEEYHVFKESDTEVENGLLGELDLSQFPQGNYEILLTVEDKSGNKSYFSLLLYLETGIPNSYTLMSEITEISYDEIAEEIHIYGSVDANDQLSSYTLSLKQGALGEEEILATGEEKKDKELLKTLDSSNLETGTYHLTLTVYDKAGNAATSCGTFTYVKEEEMKGGVLNADVHAPIAKITNVSLTDNEAYVNIRATVRDDQELKGYTLEYAPLSISENSLSENTLSNNTVPTNRSLEEISEEEYILLASGENPIEDSVLGTIATMDLLDGTYALRLKAWDTFDNCTVHTATFTYTKGKEVSSTPGSETEGPKDVEIPVNKENQDNTNKEFRITLSKSRASLGSYIEAYVTLPNGVTEQDLEIQLNGETISKGQRRCAFVAEQTGENEVTALIQKEGEEQTVSANCFVYNNEDQTAPVAELITPEPDAVLIKPVDIVGSAYDEEELYFYKLEYRLEGEKEYTLLSEGTEPKKEEVLGHLDTTTLINGKYEIRLWVQDFGGNIVKVTNHFLVEGNLKVGAMNLGFTDITSEMGTTTVQVNRMYNSLNKKSGDFGYGWTLSMQGIELYESNSIESGYKMTQSGKLFGTTYQLSETKSHDILVNYGDGTSDRFKLTFSPEMKALVPITETKVGYTCVTNPNVKLEILADTTAYVTSASLTFYDDAMYDHLRYKLTTEDGVEIYLSTLKGVYQIVDTTGNVIIVDENGYHAENGKSITLERDEEGRVISATDVNGNVTTYTYDKDGNLATVTDKAGNTVSFSYDDNHNLLSIIDPMGVATARNEYDETGRLIATIDADGNRMEYTYDVEGRTQAVKDRRGNTTVYTYDDNGNILKTVDALGNATYNTHDERGNRLSTTDANGNTTSYTYDAMNNVTKVEAADGTKVESTYTQQNYVSTIQMMDKTVIAMDYDTMGRITEITDANGNETTYTYNSDGRLTSLCDQIGEYQKITYDWYGKVASTTDGEGQKTEYTYDKKGNCTRILITKKDKNGVTRSVAKSYTYDDAGNVTKSLDTAGNVTTYEYDANGNQTACVDTKGRKTQYTYDDLGNLTKITYPDGTHETFVYDENGNTIQATDRNGLVANMVYDKLDRLVKKTYADGTYEAYQYDGAGNLISQRSTSGATTTYTYNNRNLNTSITDAYGAVTTFVYDEAARLIKTTDNEGNEITYEYDANGNTIKTTYADGSFVTADYDERNRMTKQRDQNGNETTYEYNQADHLTKVTDANGNSYIYEYDGGENLVSVTDPLGKVTKYAYNNLGQVTGITNALGKWSSYGYDSAGNMTYYSDNASVKTFYNYDKMDRLVSGGTGSRRINYTYTGDNLTKVQVNNKDEVNYAYDTYNRLITKTDAKGNQIAYNYDQYGRIDSITVEGKKTTYEYDLLDRVTRVIDHNGQATVYEYDSLGNRSTVRYPNGTILTYTYDACQRLKEECLTDASGKQLAKYNYTLGKAGERTKITETNEDGTITEISYKYDKLNRLVKEEIACDGSKLINEFTYDAVSNRISKETTVQGDVTKVADVAETVSDGSNLDDTTGTTSGDNDYEIQITEGNTEYAYNDLNQLIRETNEDKTIIYEYDVNGNLIKQTGDKTVTYSYNQVNQLVKATIQKGNAVTTETYEYDYAGNRISKQVNEENKTYYIIDESSGLAQVVAEVEITKDASNKETKNLIATYTLNGNERISVERDGNTSYYVYDGHGNVRALTNEEGNITDNYSYDAYGNLLQAEGETKNDFLYTGEQYNASTGLYYLRARYMNPSTGTFISMDSYQGNAYDPITLHKYLYANANPVMNTDPTGYMALTDMATGVACWETGSSGEVQHNRVIISIAAHVMPLLRTTVAVGNAVIRLQDAIGAILLDEDLLDKENNIERIVEIVNEQVKAEAEKDRKSRHDYVVYTLVDSEGIVRYVGRTKDYDRRINEHKKSPTGKIKLYGLREGKVILRHLTKEQARGLEQTLLVLYHTANFTRDPDISYYNFVNGVAKTNTNGTVYHEAAKDYMQKYPSLFENFVEEEQNAIKEDMGAWW